MNKQPPTVEEQLSFFENIFNDESLCAIILAGLTSPDELEGNKKNQESSIQISKMILENIDKIKFKSEERKAIVKHCFEKVPEIVVQYQE